MVINWKWNVIKRIFCDFYPPFCDWQFSIPPQRLRDGTLTIRWIKIIIYTSLILKYSFIENWNRVFDIHTPWQTDVSPLVPMLLQLHELSHTNSSWNLPCSVQSSQLSPCTFLSLLQVQLKFLPKIWQDLECPLQ